MPSPSDEQGESESAGKDGRVDADVEDISSSPDVSSDTSKGGVESDEEIPFSLRLGRIGKFFGAEPEKAGNIVAFTITCSFVVLLAVVVIQWQITRGEGAENGVSGTAAAFPHFHVIITSLVSIITASLGYLFGESKRK